MPMIMRLRDQFAKAMEQIRLGASIDVGQIVAGFRNATPQLKSYIRQMLLLAEANKIVADAQEELNKVTEKYDNILDPLYRQLDRLTDATQDFDDERRKSQLELILTDVNASEGDKRRALLELERLQLEKNIRGVENERDVAVDAAEQKLKAAEAKRDALEAEFKAAEGLLDVQIKTNELIKEQIALLEALKEAAAGSGGIADNIADIGLDIGGIDFDPEETLGDWTTEIDRMFLEAKNNVDQFFKDVVAAIGDAFDPLIEEGGLLDQLGEKIGIIMDGSGSEVTRFSTLMSIAGWQISTAWQAIVNTLQWAGEQIALALGLTSGEFDALTVAIIVIRVVVSRVTRAIVESIFFVTTVLTTLINGFRYAGLVIQGWAENMKSIFENVGFIIPSIIFAMVNTIISVIQFFVLTIIGFVEGFVRTIINAFQFLSDEIIGNSIIPEMLDNITTAFTTFFTDRLADLQTWIDEVLTKFTNLATSLYDKGKDAVQGLWNGFKDKWTEFWTWLQGKYQSVLNTWDKITNSTSPSKEMIKRGQYLMEGLAIGIQEGAHIPAYAMAGVGQTVSMGAVAGATTYDNSHTVHNNYTLTMPTTATPASVERAFNVMAVMSR